MKTLRHSLIIASFLIINLIAKGNDVENLIDALRNVQRFQASVELELTLPMAANDDVYYQIELLSERSVNDSLSPIDYLIQWALDVPTGTSIGFSAYFDGNFYRYRQGSKLQEYHFRSSPEPFLTSTPVQLTNQFFECFPSSIADELGKIIVDSTYDYTYTPDTMFMGKKVHVLSAVRTINDIVVNESVYIFDGTTNLPVRINKEMSPGSISEQTLEYSYRYSDVKGQLPTDEDALIDMFPETFALYREGNYGISSLKGNQTPSFSLSTLNGQRFSHTKGESFNVPFVMVFLNETVASTPQVIADVTNVVRALPRNVVVKYIFLSNRHDDIEPILPKQIVSDDVLISGRNVSQLFGITETPSFIFINSNGKVSDTHVGYNKDLKDIVLQKTTNLK